MFSFLYGNSLSLRLNDLTVANERLKVQVSEKEKSLSALQRSVSALEQQIAADQSESEMAKNLREETEDLHSALRLEDASFHTL